MNAIASRLLRWYDQHGRHDLPWQHPRSAYRVWISETMLQQTQVATVIPYFQHFIARWPDLHALAAAALDDVLAAWSGLGYYARARHLHAAATICLREYAGELPRDLAALCALPGIGRSTAGAIMALAHDRPQPILDGNVRRVLCRHRGVRGWPGSASVQQELWTLAAAWLPTARCADYTQALMDLGATLCTPAAPDCTACPLREDCIARNEDLVAALPERKPGKPLPQRTTCALIVRDRAGRVLLQRRPPVGVWAGLWSLPEADGIDTAQAWVDRHARVGEVETLHEIPHVFSHFRLRIHPLLWRDARAKAVIGDNADLRWHAVEDLPTIGLPAPIRRLLEEIT
ncbi:MAG: A/G-specific adenine glycosylase [Proteobacteria bacterium]|nr:A/G-specific adenine glycosylase [Pseudomonadota bacterium]